MAIDPLELHWTRRYSFQSVHSLNTGILKERRHGHHYFLEVTFAGRQIDEVDAVVEQTILSRLHGRELVGEDLKALNPSTGETIVDWIHGLLLKTSLKSRIKAVAIQETRKNRFISRLSEDRYV